MNSQQDNFLEIHNSIDYSRITDHPNILIAAKFWEHERYCAAKICYKFMRTIDDLINDHKARNIHIAPHEREEFTGSVKDWLTMIIKSEECNPLQLELIETVKSFRIPLRPLEDFAASMIYDINNDGFPTLDVFLDYSRGASVAPASIFVHLNCLQKNGLTRADLREFAEGRPVTPGFRNLIRHYYSLAEEYKQKTMDIIRIIKPQLEPRYQLSLDIIFDLYLMVFERIDPDNGQFTTEELNPTSEETEERVYRKILSLYH